MRQANTLTWRSAAGRVVVLVLLLSACGRGSAGSESWVGGDAESAILVRWTETSSGSVTGTMQLASLPFGASSMDSQSWSMLGSRAGSSVTLTLDIPFAADVTLVGDIELGRLTLFFPTDGRGFDPIMMVRGTVGDFNRRVTELRSSAAAGAARDAELRDAVAAADEAQRRLDAARSDLTYSISELDAEIRNVESWLDQATGSLEQLWYRVDQVNNRANTNPELVPGEIELAVGQWEIVAADLAALADAASRVNAVRSQLNLDISALEAETTRSADTVGVAQDRQLIADATALEIWAGRNLDALLASASDIATRSAALLIEARSLHP